MFATVVIVLPSVYTGGQVHATHNSSTKIFDFHSTSITHTSVLAWYTDVRHEVKPITSGYRLGLSYNLIQTNPGVPRPCLPNTSHQLESFRHTLHKWSKNAYEEYSDLMAYILGQEYSVADLKQGARCLKGADAQLVANLRGVAKEEGFIMLLANLEQHVTGQSTDDYGFFGYGYKRRRHDYGYSGYGYMRRRHWYDDFADDIDYDGLSTPDMGEIENTSCSVSNVVDLDGYYFNSGSSIPVDEESLIPKDPFEGADPDDREGDVSFFDPHFSVGRR